MNEGESEPVGIDDMSIHFPRLYMDMREFADLRGADFGKLNKGFPAFFVTFPPLPIFELFIPPITQNR